MTPFIATTVSREYLFPKIFKTELATKESAIKYSVKSSIFENDNNYLGKC